MRTVTININQRCPLRCKHCSLGFSESHHGADTSLDPATLRSIIRDIDSRIYSMVLLAGGEPSLSPALIREGIGASRNVGLLSAIVTAPIWAHSVGTASQFLDKIPGLDMLILSFDDYHLEFLRWEHYRDAALEALKRHIGLVFQIAYTREDQKRRLVDSLKGLAALSQVNPMRTVMIGNAADNHLDTEYIEVTACGDLDKIPRGCVLGNAFIDDRLGVHGCCWSTAVEASPFSVLPGNGPASLRGRFQQLEDDPVFQAVRAGGFIEALGTKGRRAVVDAVRGERFSSECDLCMRLMKYEARHIWNECAARAGSVP